MAKKDIWDSFEQEWIFNELYDDNFSQEDAGPHDQKDGTEAGENWPEHCCQEFFSQTPLLFRFVDQVSILIILNGITTTYIINQLIMTNATSRRLPERRPNCLGLTGDWYGVRLSIIP